VALFVDDAELVTAARESVSAFTRAVVSACPLSMRRAAWAGMGSTLEWVCRAALYFMAARREAEI
jgi:hypothetical protein